MFTGASTSILAHVQYIVHVYIHVYLYILVWCFLQYTDPPQHCHSLQAVRPPASVPHQPKRIRCQLKQTILYKHKYMYQPSLCSAI